MWERVVCACRTELVWDGGRKATGLAPEGAPARVGLTDGWHPEQLLAMAADASTMLTFLAIAEREGLPVLGYVSSARVTHDDADPDGVRIVLAPCVIVADPDGIRLAASLLDEAVAESPVVRSLRTVPRLEPEIVVEAFAAMD